MTLEVDPVYYFAKPVSISFYKYLELDYEVYENLVDIFRYFYLTFYATDITRLIGCIFIIMSLQQRSTVCCLRNIRLLATAVDLKRSESRSRVFSFHYYQCFRSIIKLTYYVTDAIAFFSTAGGGVCLILAIFTTVKLHHAIPMPTFLIFPCTALLARYRFLLR